MTINIPIDEALIKEALSYDNYYSRRLVAHCCLINRFQNLSLVEFRLLYHLLRQLIQHLARPSFVKDVW